MTECWRSCTVPSQFTWHEAHHSAAQVMEQNLQMLSLLRVIPLCIVSGWNTEPRGHGPNNTQINGITIKWIYCCCSFDHIRLLPFRCNLKPNSLWNTNAIQSIGVILYYKYFKSGNKIIKTVWIWVRNQIVMGLWSVVWKTTQGSFI